MVSVPKIIDKMRRQPNGIRYQEADKVLKSIGMYPVRKNGSHLYYDGELGVLSIPIHGKTVKKTYLEDILRLVEASNEK